MGSGMGIGNMDGVELKVERRIELGIKMGMRWQTEPGIGRGIWS